MRQWKTKEDILNAGKPKSWNTIICRDNNTGKWHRCWSFETFEAHCKAGTYDGNWGFCYGASAELGYSYNIHSRAIGREDFI